MCVHANLGASLLQPIGADVTNCDVISARNLFKAVDWLILSLASNRVNDMLVYESQKHDIGQNWSKSEN